LKLALSEQQEMLRDTVAKFLQTESSPARVRAAEPLGFDAELWRGLVVFGMPMMRVPEALGGVGLSLFDAALIAEQGGRHLASAPLVEAIVATRLLVELGGDLGQEWFNRVLQDNALVTLALHDAAIRPEQAVPGGAVADAILFLDEDEIVLRAGPPPGRAALNLGKSSLARIVLADREEDVTHEIVAHGPAARAAFLAGIEEWKILTAAAATGLGRRALEMAAAYASEREAFGRLIGTYQGVSHPLADSITDIDGAQLLVWRAIWAIARGRQDAAASVSMAFWWASQSTAKAVNRSLRVFGGYGLSVEYDIQLYFRRGKAMALPLGDPKAELVRVADRLWLGQSSPLPDSGDVEIEFGYGAAAVRFEKEIRRFFSENLTADLRRQMRQSLDGYNGPFQRKLAEAGFLYPDWPDEYGGRGRNAYEMSALGVAYEAYDWSRVPIGTTNMGARMAMMFGSDELKAEALPRFADGSATSCLGFTEPGCGSDVFAAKTRAVRDGDDWIINGQKIFTTAAHVSDYVLLITRTDPDVPKHKGLTMFLVPMTSPGIAVQPVHTMQEERTNITFYADVRVPDRYRLGPVGGAVGVMAAAMKYEHSGEGYHISQPALIEAAVAWAGSTRDESGLSRLDDPDVRARIAKAAVHNEVADLLCRRAVWAGVEGVPSRAFGPMSKLFTSETYMHDSADLLELAAPDSLFEGHDPLGIVEYKHRHAIANTIYGGTSEIHRSVIAEQALGLPRTRG
jgi:alkylation response protein AidB-like acyl-CoA dehydrogenase